MALSTRHRCKAPLFKHWRRGRAHWLEAVKRVRQVEKVATHDARIVQMLGAAYIDVDQAGTTRRIA